MGVSITSLTCFAIPGIPLIHPGDDLVSLTINGLRDVNYDPKDKDVFCIHKKSFRSRKIVISNSDQ